MNHVSTFKVLATISYTLIAYYLSLVFLEDTDGSLNVELLGMMIIAEKESAYSTKIMESLYAGIAFHRSSAGVLCIIDAERAAKAGVYVEQDEPEIKGEDEPQKHRGWPKGKPRNKVAVA